MRMIIGGLLAALLTSGTSAQNLQGHDMSGHDMGQMNQMAGMPSSALHEGGQSAFAAIAEATRALEADPATDWSKVKIDALREHLVDMDNVTLRSDVSTTAIAGGARFAITSGDPGVRGSIDRMVRLHAGMANSEGAYKFVPENIPAGVALMVTGSSPADTMKIRGLGFFGLLTEGVHHERHHLMLAKGEEMHH